MRSLHLFALLLCTAFAPSVFGQNTQRVIPFFSVLQPASLYAQYPAHDPLIFAPLYYSAATFGASVDNGVVRGLAAVPSPDSLFCDPNATDFTGKFAIIWRGSCEFSRKVLNAQNQGAIGVIIVTFGESVINMAPGSVGDSVTIPVIMVRNSIGTALLNALTQGQVVEVAFSSSPVGFALLEGFVRRDANANCTADLGEQPLQHWMVQAEGASGGTTATLTDSAGHYTIWVDTLQTPYTVSMLPPTAAWAACPAVQVVNLSGPDTVRTDFSAQPLSDCVDIQADITTPFLRRCFPNVFKVSVCNQGTKDATDAYADVTLAPEFEPITDATLPYTTVSPDVYRFQFGTLASGECLTFQFRSVINCDSTTLEQTLCYSVHAYPDTLCDPILPLWSGANVSVIGTCNGNEVQFRIVNTGTAGMAEQREYVIIEDDVMRQEGPFQLGPGAERVFTLPANGSTWRLEAQQEPNHPRPSTPAVALEGCDVNGGTFSTGFITMFPIYDASRSEDNECQQVIGSFDPNDKQGFPRGVGPQHLIRENTDIEYLIRFQNTGTDTAFTVVVRDTLPAALDASRIRLGASSHPYEFEKTVDNVLVFRFKNILLVDSFANEPLSHGYLSFHIAQQPDLAYGTKIENSAAIYFDFNPPVITNTTEHEVGKVVGVSLAKEPGRAAAPRITVFPNPAAAATVLQLRGEGIEGAPWRLFDAAGKQWAEGRLDGVQVRLPQQLPAGMVWLEVRDKSGQAFFVKIVLE